MKICPDCKNEILPYMKTGELKRINIINKLRKEDYFLTTYQCYFCVHCKTVFYHKHEEFKFKELE